MVLNDILYDKLSDIYFFAETKLDDSLINIVSLYQATKPSETIGTVLVVGLLHTSVQTCQPGADLIWNLIFP